MLVAWGLLLFRLDATPPGFQHDQMFSAKDAMEVVNGSYPIYFPDNFGRGPLFMYSAAGMFILTAGRYVWSLHFTAVVWGMLGLAAAITLARRYLSDAAALFAAALMASSFWFLLAARLGVESVALLPLAVAMFYFLDRGLAHHSLRDFAVAGVLGGVANYTYLASRTLYALPLLLLALLSLAMLLQKRRTGNWPAYARRDFFGLLLAWAVMVAVSGPLLWYLAHHSGTDGRIGQLVGPVYAALEGDLRPLLANAWDTVRTIFWRGSAALPFHYSVPGRPELQPITAVCFLIGLGLTLVRAQCWHESLLLVALLLGLAANLLTGADALHMRAVYAMPLIFMLTTRGLWRLLSASQRLRLSLGRRVYAPVQTPILQIAILGGVFLWHAVGAATAYFDTWSHDEQTQRIYNADFRAAARFLDAHAGAEPIFMGTDRQRDLDSLTYSFYEPSRKDVRWFSLPDVPPMPADGVALYLLPASVKLPETLEALTPIMRDRFQIPAAYGDYNLIQGFRLAADDLDQLLQEWGRQPLAQPVIFGNALRLDAAGLRRHAGRSEFISSWTVLAPWPRAARPGYLLARPKLSVSLTDDAGYRWSQDDVTTALPVLSWEPGQRLLEITPISISPDIPPGAYQVRLAMYDDEQGQLAMHYGEIPIAVPPSVATVQLAAGDPTAAPQPPFPLDARGGQTGSLHLLGRWEELGQLIVGLPATVHLSWQAPQTISTAGLAFRVRARADDGAIVWEQTANPDRPLPATWDAGQTFRLAHRLVPATARAGVTPAVIEICTEQGRDAAPCEEIARSEVINQPPLLALPQAPDHGLRARWEGGPTLVGYNLAENTQTISLTLFWQAGASPSEPLKRFVHAVGPDQTIIAQSDDELRNGQIPLAFWRPDEFVVDPVNLKIPDGGVATLLYIGLYDPVTGKRSPVQAAAEGAIDDQRVVIHVGQGVAGPLRVGS